MVFDESEMKEAVVNAVSIAKQLRDNPNNVGGNETSIYYPSTYFNPDPEFIADQRPIWMKHPKSAHFFLVCVIASDFGFDSKSYLAFFSAFNKSQATEIIINVSIIGESEYNNILQKFGCYPSLKYTSFKEKFRILSKTRIDTYRE